MKKGQVSIELITYTFISLIMFSTYYIFVSQYLHADAQIYKSSSANNLAYHISKELNMVYLMGDGFHINLTLPNYVISSSYEVHIENNFVYLSMSDPPSTYIQPLIFNSSYLSLSPGKINEVYNVGGKVHVNTY